MSTSQSHRSSSVAQPPGLGAKLTVGEAPIGGFYGPWILFREGRVVQREGRAGTNTTRYIESWSIHQSCAGLVSTNRTGSDVFRLTRSGLPDLDYRHSDPSVTRGKKDNVSWQTRDFKAVTLRDCRGQYGRIRKVRQFRMRSVGWKGCGVSEEKHTKGPADAG